MFHVILEIAIARGCEPENGSLRLNGTRFKPLANKTNGFGRRGLFAVFFSGEIRDGRQLFLGRHAVNGCDRSCGMCSMGARRI